MGRLGGTMLRTACIAAIGALLAACSAADYKQPIIAFSDSTKKAAATLTDYEKTLDQAALNANMNYAVMHPMEVRHKKGECVQGKKHCRLVLRGKDGKEHLLSPGPIDPRIRSIMAALVVYADNLKAIATADTSTDIKSAADAAQANAINLAKAIDAFNAQHGITKDPLEPQVTKFAPPVQNAAVFVLDQYADAVKLQALRNATRAMNVVFPSFMKVASQVVDAGMTIKRDELAAAFDHSDQAFFEAGNAVHAARIKRAADSKRAADGKQTPDDAPPPQVDRDKLLALEAAAEAYDSSLQNHPEAIFHDLATAHDKLTKALNDPQITWDQFWAIMQRLSDDANKLAGIVNSVRTASAGH